MTEHNQLIMAGSRVRLRLATDDRLVAFVRRGDIIAFEVLYERHARSLLSFCVYMLRSRHDAEDAVQATFVSAHRALLADARPVTLRPWLFAIARNDCLSILRTRRPTVELNGEPALGGDPLRELELHEEVRHMLESLDELPESQRAALVLAELHGLSHAEIGAVLGVETAQVKAYVYQARSNLISDRQAREVDCREIREELATAHGAALLRGRLRRHLRACEDCRVYADGVARQRRHLGALVPLAPSLLLKYRAVEDALGIGGADPATYAGGAAVAGSVAGTAADIAGGGIKALAVKMAAGAAMLGATAGVGASVFSGPATSQERTSPAQHPPPSLLASAEANGWSRTRSPLAGRPEVDGSPAEARSRESRPSPSHTRQSSPANEGPDTGVGNPGGEPAGSAQESQPGQSEGHPPKNRARPPVSQEERKKESEEDKQESQERKEAREEEKQQKSEERKKESEEDRQESQERKKAHEEEKQQKSEERKHEREERERIGRSRPPRNKEERERAREERVKRREEREQRHRERQERK